MNYSLHSLIGAHLSGPPGSTPTTSPEERAAPTKVPPVRALADVQQIDNCWNGESALKKEMRKGHIEENRINVVLENVCRGLQDEIIQRYMVRGY